MPESTPTAAAPSSLLDQFHRWLRWARWALWAAAGFFVLVALFEGVRLFQTAYGVHPAFGYLTIAGILAAGALIAWPIWRFLHVPRVVRPPAVPASDELGIDHLRAEVRYLERYLTACRRNEELADQAQLIDEARTDLRRLAVRVRSGTDAQAAELGRELTAWTGERMTTILADLDARAEKLIYREALAVGVGTAASPNGTLDAFVVLWRSVNLASRLAVLYYGRPGLWGTLAICRDVSLATAAAAYLQNVTDSLGGLLARTIGGVTGVVAGPAVEGITNALVVVRIGYLARARCRSFREWDPETRKSALSAAFDATQKVAVGLTTEILRTVGGGLGVVAEAAASSVGYVAGAAVDTVTSAAESAKNAAVDLGQRVGLLKKKAPDEPAPEGESEG